MTKHRVVACPHCGKPVEWMPAARWRPFCSERCKMIDLGAWATGAYRIATSESPDPDDLTAEPDTAPHDQR